ncbi:MAG: EAL domain-containing protein [Bacilli bacterium]
MAFLDELWVALQPIVNLNTGSVLGHEALIRGPSGSDWETPDKIFALAQQIGQVTELEMRCRQLGLDALDNTLPAGQTLFLNVAVEFERLPLNLQQYDLSPARVALEISERAPIVRDSPALKIINHWRAQGHPIVLDDYGSGYASLDMAITVHPDILKLDRKMIAEVDRDPFRYDVLHGMVALWHDKNVRVLAEGIETAEELAALQSLGVDYGQGYFLGRPQAVPHVGLIQQVTSLREQRVDDRRDSPYRVLLNWSPHDQEEWVTYREGLALLRPTFFAIVNPFLDNALILPAARWRKTPVDRLKSLLHLYGANLIHDPRDPVVRERARQLGREHRQAGVSPAWYVMLYNYYFQAYHRVHDKSDAALPRLSLFRKRWLLDLADTLDAYDDTLKP